MRKGLHIVLTLLLAGGAAVPMIRADIGYQEQAENNGLPGTAFTTFGTSVRALALGKAYTALGGDGGGAYWNPSNLSEVHTQEISLMQGQFFTGSSYNFIGYTYPTETGDVFGVSRIGLDSPDIPKVSPLGEDLGTFKDSQSTYNLTYANAAFSDWSWGANVRLALHTLDTQSAWGGGLDAGVLYSGWNPARLGLAVANLVPADLKLKDDDELFPMTVRAGAALVDLWGGRLLVTGDVQMVNVLANGQPASWRWGAGTELKTMDLLSLRAGIDTSAVSMGFGVQVRGMSFDYAALLSGSATNHVLGLNIRLGMPLTEKERLLEEERRKFESEKQTFELTTSVRANLDKGDYLQAEKDLADLKKLNPRKDVLSQLEGSLRQAENRGQARKLYEQGRTLYAAKQVAEADDVLQKAKTLAPEDADIQLQAHLVHSVALIDQEKYKEAEQELIQVIKVDPQNAEAKRTLGKLQSILQLMSHKLKGSKE